MRRQSRGRLGVLLLAALAPIVLVAPSSARVQAITVTTQLSASSVAVGVPVTDQATLGGVSATAGGTVSYNVYTTPDCSGTPVFTSSVTVKNAVPPRSASFTATAAGTYQWQAVYKQYPDKVTSACGSEPLIVKTAPTVATTLSRTTAVPGDAVTDQATLAGATATAGGTLTYGVYSTGDCSGSPDFTSTVPVTNATVPPSTAFSAATVGTYQWQASYSGDAMNQGALSACGSEQLVVGQTAVTTQLSTASAGTGDAVTDQAILSGVTASAGGTVAYAVYASAGCTGSPVFTSTVTVSNGVAPASGPFTASPAGTYQWLATYSGDKSNAPATSACGSEQLTVKNRPGITTQLSANAVNKGDVVTDQATLVGASADAGGSVTYTAYATSDCSGSPVFTSTVAVTTGAVPASGAFTADPIGTYQWRAAYTGDAKNYGVTAACGAESLTVNAEPMIPLIDMDPAARYYGYQGGLYENGTNAVPADHASLGLQRANQVTPLAADGTASPSGKIVLLSIGASSMSAEWCGTQDSCTSPKSPSFMSFAAANPNVNHTTLAIVNGADTKQTVSRWIDPGGRGYTTVLSRLSAAGLTEAQVQVIWFKDVNPAPSVSLPSANADMYSLVTEYGQALRAIKVRYPNIREVFFSSRIYGGYTDPSHVSEPYSYETGFAVKWVIQAQVDQDRGGAVDARTAAVGSSTVPWIAWAAYMWANGTTPRSDGLVWLRSDFETDGEHPSTAGKTKVANMLMSFFLNSPFTRCWFTNTGAPCA